MARPEKVAEVIARLAGEAPESKYIRAYHGSPMPEHFDRFDARHIGSGEGNQTFAYGHYSAQDKNVGDTYRLNLSHRKLKDDFLDQLPEDADPEEVIRAISSFDPKQQRFLRALDKDDYLGYDYPSQAISAALRPDGLRQYQTGRDIAQELLDSRGNLGTGYELQIDVPESSLLDWDAPLAEQKPKLSRAWDAIREQWAREHSAALRAGVQSPVPVNAEDVLADMQHNPAYNGQSLWQMAVNAFGGKSLGAPPAADLLHEAGIPGVRYLDQKSRPAGQGTRNYVVFPGAEDQIRILRKYAVPGAIGAGAASGMQGEQ